MLAILGTEKRSQTGGGNGVPACQAELAPRRQGFSLPEALIAMLIAGLASSALLLSAGYCLHATEAAREDTQATLLAQMLMNVISACRWADADAPAHWGPESGELSGPGRTLFDDLDDYDGWSGPPQTRDGVRLESIQQQEFAGVQLHPFRDYSLSVEVIYATSTGEPVPGAQTSTFRKVTIAVSNQSRVVYQLERLFADLSGMDDTIWLSDTGLGQHGQSGLLSLTPQGEGGRTGILAR